MIQLMSSLEEHLKCVHQIWETSKMCPGPELENTSLIYGLLFDLNTKIVT